MPPPAPSILLTDDAGIEQVFGRCGVIARLDTNRTKQISTSEEEARTFAKNYGTAFVYGLLGGRYSLAQMANDYIFYWLASVVAAHNLAGYRCSSIPASLQAEFERTEVMIEKLASGQMRVASIPSLSGSGVSIDNIRLDGRFRVKQQRIVQPLSSGPVQRSPHADDISANIVAPYEPDR